MQLIAILALLLFSSFVVWSGWHYATTAVRTQVVSFTSTEKVTVVRYQLTRRDASTALTCRVSAEDYQRRVVGEVSDVIPAGSRTMTRIVEVPTLKKAAAGFVSGCVRR